MTKKTRKTPTKHKKPQKRKRIYIGKIDAAVKKLDQLYGSAVSKIKCPQRRTGEERALLTFIEAHQKPYVERGDRYLEIIQEIGSTITPAMVPRIDAIPKAVKAMVVEIADLRRDRETRLNYDDMREALLGVLEQHKEGFMTLTLTDKGESSVNRTPQEKEPEWLQKVRRAFIGAPFSDVGAMRGALKATDNVLTELLRSMDETTPRSVVMTLWELVHGARKAMASAPGPDVREQRAAEFNEMRIIMFELCNMIFDNDPNQDFQKAPDRLAEQLANYDILLKKLTTIHHAVLANDPRAISKDGLTKRACNLIMEAISLRAFLDEESEARVRAQAEVFHWMDMSSHWRELAIAVEERRLGMGLAQGAQGPLP